MNVHLSVETECGQLLIMWTSNLSPLYTVTAWLGNRVEAMEFPEEIADKGRHH